MDISNRIKQRMDDLGLKGVDITKATGMSSGGVSQWVNGLSKPNAERLISLSKVLECQPDWLLHGKEDPNQVGGEYTLSNVTPSPVITGKVPLISWVQAGAWTDINDNLEPGDTEEWRVTTANVGPNAFALKVKGDSMLNPSGFPSIPEGSVVIVDPDAEIDCGKIVVARLEESNVATLKKLAIDGPNRYLKALNPDYKPIQITDACTIVGVVRKVEFDL